MTAKVINLFDHLKGDQREAHDALMRALVRPFPEAMTRESLTPEFAAAWLLQGLWFEGFRVTPLEGSDDDVS